MFEFYSSRAQSAVEYSVLWARDELGLSRIGTEHLLVGLLAIDRGTANLALTKCGLGADRLPELRQYMAGLEQPDEPGLDVPPFSRSYKQVLGLALLQALRLGNQYIGTEHLLLALAMIRPGDGGYSRDFEGVGESGRRTGGLVLERFGVDLLDLRGQIFELIKAELDPKVLSDINRHGW